MTLAAATHAGPRTVGASIAMLAALTDAAAALPLAVVAHTVIAPLIATLTASHVLAP